MTALEVRPTVRAEITLGRIVCEILLHAGGPAALRARVAVGLIEARVVEAYRDAA